MATPYARYYQVAVPLLTRLTLADVHRYRIVLNAESSVSKLLWDRRAQALSYVVRGYKSNFTSAHVVGLGTSRLEPSLRGGLEPARLVPRRNMLTYASYCWIETSPWTLLTPVGARHYRIVLDSVTSLSAGYC